MMHELLWRESNLPNSHHRSLPVWEGIISIVHLSFFLVNLI
jgi:hypothetical protein